MADDAIEEYAQLENNHILLQLVGARPPTGEIWDGKLAEVVLGKHPLPPDHVRRPGDRDRLTGAVAMASGADVAMRYRHD